jgi:hypothetical protein
VQEFYKALLIADEVWDYRNKRNLRSKKGENFARPYVTASQSDIKLLDPTAKAWTNFEEKYFKVNQEVYELVLEKGSDKNVD